MVQKEFYRASLRHLQSCNALIERIASCDNPQIKSTFISEVYYLSGYVIETILSWAIFQQHNYRGDILKSDIYNDGCFKTHNLTSKSNVALKKYGCNLRGVTFIDQSHSDRILQNMYSKWTIDLRYQNYKEIHSELIIEESTIKRYLKEVESIFRIITQKYNI